MNYCMKDAILWLQELLRIKSVEDAPSPGCPFGLGVADSLDYSLNLMQKFGFKTKNLDGYCGIADIGVGDMFGILVHLDVVPEGCGWSHPPYGAEIHGNNLYARGATDDKGPFVAALYAVVMLLQEGYTPAKKLRFILGCDEESGWKCIEHYNKVEQMPDIGISPDADFPVINCEKGIVYHYLSFPLHEGITEIYGGERGNMVPDSAFCRLKYSDKVFNAAPKAGVTAERIDDCMLLKACGVSAHGSHPEKGDNALYKLFCALSAEYPVFGRLYDAFSDGKGESIGLDLSDEKSGRLTLNLGTCKIIDSNIVCELDIRHPISYNKEEITAILRSELPCGVEQGNFHDPLYVDSRHPLVQTLLKAYDGATQSKTPSQPISIGGGTYARALKTGVAFGPMLPGMVSTMHEKDEYISLEHFELLVKIYYKAIKELCFL
ncbi:MAG: Sapep family Mn(2+)-dependent dipeptidase [Clostridia bacterium]|nr:Sapep family Mn(2+)-dependent dipeptidase [Clostridia bacterium]